MSLLLSYWVIKLLVINELAYIKFSQTCFQNRGKYRFSKTVEKQADYIIDYQ
jgi:hypothetical protein